VRYLTAWWAIIEAMNIDVGSILTAAGVAAATSGVVLLAAKRIIENLIDNKFRRAAEERAASLAEKQRRNAALHDEQVKALRDITQVAYQCRDKVRRLAVVKVDPRTCPAAEEFKALAPMLVDELYKARSIFPEDVFGLIHRLRHLCMDVEMLLDSPETTEARSIRENLSDKAVDIEGVFQATIAIARAYQNVEPFADLISAISQSTE